MKDYQLLQIRISQLEALKNSLLSSQGQVIKAESLGAIVEKITSALSEIMDLLTDLEIKKTQEIKEEIVKFYKVIKENEKSESV